MVPGGVTETIWHFAGYFHRIEEVMKDRFVYEQGGINVQPDDYVLQLKDFLLKSDIDDFDTDKIPFTLPAFSETPSHPFLIGSHFPPAPIGEVDGDANDLRVSIPRIGPPFLGPIVAWGHVKDISVTYHPGGEQQLLEIKQLNIMSDDDRLLVTPDSGVENLNRFDADAALERLAAAAANEVPADLALPHSSTTSVVDFIVSRDVQAAQADIPDPHSVAFGRYLNGELQPAPDAAATPEEPAPELDRSLKGQWGMLGGNEATNAALIVDMKEGSNTTIVLGDYYKTNVIVQTNSYIDNDHIDVSSLFPHRAAGGGNVAENIGEFQQHAGPYAEFQGFAAGFRWNVEIVHGDFYDINLVVQHNLLRDNDILVQNTSQTHYEAHLGENEQLNLARITDGSIKYDLIIVGGDYHGANWIFQHNIILDPDIVKIAATGAAGPVTDQTVDTGANELRNDAKIINYGDNTFAAPTDGLQNVVAAIQDERTTLGPDYGWFVPGNGSSTLNALYVTGDYYDINAIWQSNIILDADTAIQYMNSVPPPQIAGDGSLQQSVSTGGNKAFNEAIIVDVGSTSVFVGGDVYQDTILIQGNLVGENNDKITNADTSALVPEIVAFMGEECPQEEVTDIRAPVVPDDTIGSILT
jgi:hypothetical protein